MRFTHPYLAVVISFIVAKCIRGVAAFSNCDGGGIRVSYSYRSRSLSLYKDHRQNGNLAPVYSSVASSDSWTSEATVNGMDLARVGSSSSAANELFKGGAKFFGVVADVLVKDPVTKAAPIRTEHGISDLAHSQVQVVSLVDINWLKAHENVVSEERVQNLHDAISGWDAYKLPLLVDSSSGAILDGHHRYAVGCNMNLSRLPVILVDYMNDDTISVDVWPECGLDCVTKDDVIQMSLSDTLFPPKTSMHDFGFCITPINVPLSKL